LGQFVGEIANLTRDNRVAANELKDFDEFPAAIGVSRPLAIEQRQIGRRGAIFTKRLQD
jgi:hypothetical protein